MHATTQSANTESRISLSFGQQITEQNTPISMDVQLEIYSKKVFFFLNKKELKRSLQHTVNAKSLNQGQYFFDRDKGQKGIWC